MAPWQHHAGTAFMALLADVKTILDGAGGRSDKLDEVCALLRDKVPHYDWVGFYAADDARRELTLAEYVGEPTEHVRIAYGRGVCGQAAETREPKIVPDVAAEANYLVCGPQVKSEIAWPLLKDDRLAAVIDIDSHTPSAFTRADAAFMANLAKLLAPLF